MCLHLSGSLKTKSILWLPLNKLVYEISCISWPAFRELFLSYSNLFRKHLLTDFLAGSTFIRSFSEHELITTDTKCIVINCHAMILTAHYLWSFKIINQGNSLKLPMYPGVPLVSQALSGLQYLAIPKSVTLI